MLALTGATLAGCGGGSEARSHRVSEGAGVKWFGPAGPIRGLSQRLVGHGAGATVILWSKGKAPPHEAIVFLHAWLPYPPNAYAAWLIHLAHEGNTVIYPVYQDFHSKPEGFLDGVLSGIAAGLRQVRVDPAGLVAVGDATGGALAFDYAAVGADHGLPPPHAVLAAFPGRKPPGGEVTPADLSQIPPRTLLTVIAGPDDPVPRGEAQARALLRTATQVPPGQRHYLSAPRASGPSALGARSRRAFWVPLDRMIAAVRGTSN